MLRNRRVKTPRERRRQKLLFWTVVALLVAYAVLGGDYKFYHLIFLASEKDRVARSIEELKSENAVLSRQEQRLQGDTLLLEQMARAKGMKRPGELVYRLVPVTPSQPAEGADTREDSLMSAVPARPRAGEGGRR